MALNLCVEHRAAVHNEELSELVQHAVPHHHLRLDLCPPRSVRGTLPSQAFGTSGAPDREQEFFVILR